MEQWREINRDRVRNSDFIVTSTQNINYDKRISKHLAKKTATVAAEHFLETNTFRLT